MPHAPGSRHQPIRILLADDHFLMREGFRAVLAGEPDLEVVGEASGVQETVALCQRYCPDLILLDLRMLGDGVSATRLIKAACPDAKILFVTVHGDSSHLQEAKQAGASGYLLKDVSHRDLLRAIHLVLQGQILF